MTARSPLGIGVGSAKIAYFSMEIALEPEIPTYSGGLGVLAGDFLRASADAAIPLVGVSLVHRRGYFRQRLGPGGRQVEAPDVWRPEERLERCEVWANVPIEGRDVRVTAWRYGVAGVEGDEVSVYLLDTDVPDNSDWDRRLTDSLYGGDARYRLCQEIVLGIGGERILRALGHDQVERFHMNEGHAGLLILSLLDRRSAVTTEEDIEAVRKQCVFTTHTPVPAGHDRFPGTLVAQVLGEELCRELKEAGCFENDHLNMTYLALRGAGYVNGVAMQHGEVSRGMFPGYPIAAITNGVHATTWTSPPFADLFDRHMPSWREDQLYLRYVRGVPVGEIQAAHAQAKQALLDHVREVSGVGMDPVCLTIGFARRAAVYKRADLLFSDLARLRWIAKHVGPIQLILAGRAHPADEPAKAMISRVLGAMEELAMDEQEGTIQAVYLENYDMAAARKICAGADVWLNTPQRPQEASGTSGMKAALNGVPSLSILDGWWVEGHIEGMTGWAIGGEGGLTEGREEEAGALYSKLESVVLPMFYGQPEAYGRLMRSTIAVNGSFFTSGRMLQQYVKNAYFPDHTLRMLTRERSATLSG